MDNLARQAEEQRQATESTKSEEARIQSLLSGNDEIGKAVIEAAKARISAHDTIASRTFKAEVINQPTPLAMSVDNLNVTAYSGKDAEMHAGKLDAQIKSIEKLAKIISEQEAPEGVEDVSVKNLAELIPTLEEVRDSIRNLKLQSPAVTVPAPIVKVDAPDMSILSDGLDAIKATLERLTEVRPPEFDTSPIEAATNAVRASIEAIRFPVPNFIQDPLIRYKVMDEFDDAVATSIKYYGFTDPEGHWYILKVDPSGNPKTYRYAKGTGTTSAGDYPTSWTNRATLTYDYWYQVFA